MTKFRIRKWLKLQHQKEITITAETYQNISEYSFVKLIIVGSNNGWIITVQPKAFEIIQSPYDKDALTYLVRDVIAMCRKQYLSGKVYIKRPLHRYMYPSMRKRNKHRV